MKNIFFINEIKSKILSNLRSNPSKICINCETVLKWDENNSVKQYIEIIDYKPKCYNCFESQLFSPHYSSKFVFI